MPTFLVLYYSSDANKILAYSAFDIDLTVYYEHQGLHFKALSHKESTLEEFLRSADIGEYIELENNDFYIRIS
jgi:hypothetical protein